MQQNIHILEKAAFHQDSGGNRLSVLLEPPKTDITYDLSSTCPIPENSALDDFSAAGSFPSALESFSGGIEDADDVFPHQLQTSTPKRPAGDCLVSSGIWKGNIWHHCSLSSSK